jgi:predicted adenylyl cyclase CyaB
MKAHHSMVELKARVDDLFEVRRRLVQYGGVKAGVFQQVDTYFEVPKGRLKLREMDKNGAELIYYEREDEAGPKKGVVFILPVSNPGAFRELLERALTKRTTVKKSREIYMCKGTQVHLDNVEGLGCFVEFERLTICDLDRQRKDMSHLRKLMSELGIPFANLERFSYGDLV